MVCSHVCGSDLGEAALKIVGVTTEDDGIYTCIAVNDMGSASASASLRVLGERRFQGPQAQSPSSHCDSQSLVGPLSESSK